MLQKQTLTSVIQYIANTLLNHHSFQLYHQSNRGNANLCQIKQTFNEMIIDLRQHRIHSTDNQTQSVDSKLRKGMKIWRYSEYKLFCWISVWINFTSLQTNQTNNLLQFSNYQQILLQLFPNKLSSIVSYEFHVLMRKLEGKKNIWSEDQSYSLKTICQAEQLTGGLQINWKFIAYKLHVEYGITKLSQECRERWVNHINPKLKKEVWQLQEDLQLLTLVLEQGTKWAKIAKTVKNRSEHMVKNRFKHLKNKYLRKQLDLYKHTDIKKMIRQVEKSIETQKEKQKKEITQTNQQDSIESLVDLQEILQMNNKNKQEHKVTFEFDGNAQHILSFPQFSFSEVYLNPQNVRDEYAWLDQMMQQRNHNWLQLQYN